jgi:hypothetical protein
VLEAQLDAATRERLTAIARKVTGFESASP